MIVTIENGVATVKMTADQFGALRFALAEGVDKMQTRASLDKALGHECAGSEKSQAEYAAAVSESLEKATQKYACTPTKRK